MSPQNRFNPLIRIGLVFLIVASLARWFLPKIAGLSPQLVDVATGLLYGLTIGCLLFGILRDSRRPAA